MLFEDEYLIIHHLTQNKQSIIPNIVFFSKYFTLAANNWSLLTTSLRISVYITGQDTDHCNKSFYRCMTYNNVRLV